MNKFQQIVLPRYFRHNKINSFIRQLNMYGFHKSRADHSKSVFSHPLFLRDREYFFIHLGINSLLLSAKSRDVWINSLLNRLKYFPLLLRNLIIMISLLQLGKISQKLVINLLVFALSLLNHDFLLLISSAQRKNYFLWWISISLLTIFLNLICLN